MNSPDVISIGIVWDTAQASLEEISELLCILGTTLKISDVSFYLKRSESDH